MIIQLTPSQNEVYNQLLNINSNNFRRGNYILTGQAQIGKSYLLKKIADDCGYEYHNFTLEYLREILLDKSAESIQYNHFISFLRKKFDGLSNDKVILIDEIDPLATLIIGKNEANKKMFFNQFLKSDHSGIYVIVSGLFCIDSIDIELRSKILSLDFNKADKKYLIEKYCAGLSLMDYEKIKNIRQIINSHN